MNLHFPIDQVRKGLEELSTSTTNTEEQGFYLVGDQGVYLMPNSNDGKHNAQRGKDDGRFVIYATECDPTKLDFDTWWDNKRASFGGDDGAEFLSLAEIQKTLSANPNAKNLVASMSPDSFSLFVD